MEGRVPQGQTSVFKCGLAGMGPDAQLKNETHSMIITRLHEFEY